MINFLVLPVFSMEVFSEVPFLENLEEDVLEWQANKEDFPITKDIKVRNYL